MLRVDFNGPLRISLRPLNSHCLFCRQIRDSAHRFTTSASFGIKHGKAQDKGPFRSRLRTALRNTKVDWAPIPVGLGIAFLGVVQFYKVRARERKNRDEDNHRLDGSNESSYDEQGRPKKRKRIRPSGPWYAI